MTCSGGGVAAAHNLLSATHPDTVVQTVSQGSLVYGNATPQWDELTIGTARQLFMVNAAGNEPEWISFDWDFVASAAAADMEHDHTVAGEGGQISHDTALTGVSADDHHNAFIGLEDNAATPIVPAADDRIQVTDDGIINADAVGNTLALSIDQTGIDHGNLAGLADDDHPQYFLLAGETTDAQLHSGADLIVYSDGGVTEEARIDGATGYFTTDRYASLGDADTYINMAVADQIRLVAGNIELLRVVEAAQDEVVVNEGGIDIDFRVEAVGVADAISVQGSDGQITLGVLGAGVVQSTAGGVLSSSTITTGSISDLAYAAPALTLGVANAVGAANTVIRTDATILAFDVVNPADVTLAAAVGAATVTARRDHGHALDQSITPTWTGAHVHANTVQLDDGVGDSPQLQFIGGSNDDTVLVYLDDDAVAGDSDLVVQLVDAAGDSALSIHDSTPVEVARWDSDGIIHIPTNLTHYGDPDTRLTFNVDQIDFYAGNVRMLTMNEEIAAQDEFIVNENGVDVDFRVEGANLTHAIFMQGDTDDVGINSAAPAAQLHVDQSSATGAQPVLFLDQGDVSEQCIQFSSDGADQDINLFTINVTGAPTLIWDESEDAITWNKDIHISQKLVHLGDTDTYIELLGDQIEFYAGNARMLTLFESADDEVIVNNDAGDINFRVESDTLDHALFVEGSSGNVGVNISLPLAQLHVDQSDSEGNIPVVYLDQADLGEPIWQIETTIGAGNPIQAVSGDSLSPTHYIKVVIPGGLTRYLEVGNIV